MPLFHFVLRDGAEVRDTTDLRLSDEKAARELAERMALALSRRRPGPAARRVVVVADGARERLIEVAVPQSAWAGRPDERWRQRERESTAGLPLSRPHPLRIPIATYESDTNRAE